MIVNYFEWFTTWAFVATVLYIHVFFYEGTQEKPRPTRSKSRSLHVYKYCGILRSWIKHAWDKLDE
jgi:hypothetical protein